MKSFLCGLLAVGVAALLVSSLPGEDTKKEKKKPKAKAPPYAALFSFPKTIKLDDKQKEQLEALRKEYAPKLAEVDKKFNAIMTPERRKASQEARKKAIDEGKKGKEAARAAQEALKLSADEQKSLKEIGQERGKLIKEINEKKRALLTDEQKELLKPKPKKDKGKGKPKETTTEKPKDKGK